MTWLSEVDTVRIRSKNMQDAISGLMKDRLNCSRELVVCLADKAAASGDPVF